MVGPAPELPATLGIATPKTNNCDLKTVGWELTLGWRDQMSFGLDYGIKFNLSDARTYVESYPGNPTNAIGNGNFIAGRELGEIWGLQTVGIAKTEEEMKAHIAQVGGQDQIGSKNGAQVTLCMPTWMESPALLAAHRHSMITAT